VGSLGETGNLFGYEETPEAQLDQRKSKETKPGLLVPNSALHGSTWVLGFRMGEAKAPVHFRDCGETNLIARRAQQWSEAFLVSGASTP
jgi:hypothetical protein